MCAVLRLWIGCGLWIRMTNPEPQPDTRVGSNPRIQGRVTTPRVNQSFKVQGRRVTKHPTAHQPVYRVTGRSRDALTRPAWSRPVRAHALASLAAVSSIRVSIRAAAHARSHYTRAHLSQATHHAHNTHNTSTHIRGCSLTRSCCGCPAAAVLTRRQPPRNRPRRRRHPRRRRPPQPPCLP